MFKFFKVLFILTLLCGCSNESIEDTKEEESMMIVNPIQTYDTLDEINDVVGTSITLIDSISDVRYTTVNKEIAQVDFKYQGYTICLRASFTFEGTELAGTYGEYEESKIDDYTLLNFEFGSVVVYDVNDEHRTLFFKDNLSKDEIKIIIDEIL